MNQLSISLIVALQLAIIRVSNGALSFADLSHEVHDNDDFKNFETFKHFGHRTSFSRALDIDKKPLALSLSLNANLENTFEHNFLAPKLTEIMTSSHRYTNTPTDTYQVTEDVWEPKPVPIILKPAAQPPPLILGSGSLGVVNLGNGKYALGSGSLGYSRPVDNNQLHNKEEAVGGLHVVPAPQLGSSEAFDAAFNNFDFKPLNHYFGHK